MSLKSYWQDVKNGKRTRVSQKKSKDIQCSYCKKMFYRSPANRLRKGKNQYCSRECMSLAFVGKLIGSKSPRWKNRVIDICKNCKNEIHRPVWFAKQNKNSFCNRKCFGEWKSKNWTGKDNPSWNGGKTYYYGENWKRQSRETRHRDNHKCRACSCKESDMARALDVHHITPFRFFGIDKYKEANSLSNLISLCQTCHTRAEHLCRDGNIKDAKSLIFLLRK